MITGTQVGNNMKTQRERIRNKQKIMSCISLTRRAHKPKQTGMPRKMHPETNIRSPQGTRRPKMGQNGISKGVADPLLGPIRPNFLRQSPTAPLHLFRMRIIPPRESNRGSTLGEAIRRWSAPHSTHHQVLNSPIKRRCSAPMLRRGPA